MYELFSSSKHREDISIGFQMDRARRVNEKLDKAHRGKFCVSVFLKGVFGYAEHRGNGIYGLRKEN